MVRTDVGEDRAGPLGRDSAVTDETDATSAGAAIDIWHCDAEVTYSGQGSFTTIYPGWYQGRTVHIHVMVHLGGRAVHVGRLFFDDTLTDEVYTSTAPYVVRAARSTLNANDGIYLAASAGGVLPVRKAAVGYTSTSGMKLRRS